MNRRIACVRRRCANPGESDPFKPHPLLKMIMKLRNLRSVYCAIFAAVLFLIVRPAFSYYIGRFSNYNLVYGALAGVIILVLWAYISASIFPAPSLMGSRPAVAV